LHWEISYLVGNIAPERLILWLHPIKERFQIDWPSFRQQYGDVFPKGLPPNIDRAEYIGFSGDWEAHLIGGPTARQTFKRETPLRVFIRTNGLEPTAVTG
jgi:hypothetical protein